MKNEDTNMGLLGYCMLTKDQVQKQGETTMCNIPVTVAIDTHCMATIWQNNFVAWL